MPGTAPTLEIHVPISPTPMFLRQVWALARSLRRHGGESAAQASITAWVSPELAGLPDLSLTNPWAPRLGVRFRWVDEALFARHWYYGTALARWAGPFDADVVLMLDADVLVMESLDSFIADVVARPGLHALLTHISPLTEAQWLALFTHAGLEEPDLCCVPLAADFMTFTKSRRMPPYFNLGVMAAPRAVMRQLGDGLIEEMERVNTFEENWFRCQIAVALALARQRLPWHAVDLRYNFPNIPGFEQRAPELLADARIAHYLNKTEGLSKDRDFASSAAYRALLTRAGLQGLERRIQEVLRDLGPCPVDGWVDRLRTRLAAARKRA